MPRKLASGQRGLDVVPIANADAIEAVRINGWQCVVKKNTFAVGDRGVFFEIDAVPPDTDTYRFPSWLTSSWPAPPHRWHCSMSGGHSAKFLARDGSGMPRATFPVPPSSTWSPR